MLDELLLLGLWLSGSGFDDAQHKRARERSGKEPVNARECLPPAVQVLTRSPGMINGLRRCTGIAVDRVDEIVHDGLQLLLRVECRPGVVQIDRA